MDAWLAKCFRKLSMLVDARVRRGTWVASPSNTVSPRGKKRLRRLDPELRQTAIDSVRAKKARTCAMAARGGGLDMSDTSAREATSLQMARYMQATLASFSGARSVALAFDGCKLGGEETMLTAVYSGEKQVAAWLPPQVALCLITAYDGRLGHRPAPKQTNQTNKQEWFESVFLARWHQIPKNSFSEVFLEFWIGLRVVYEWFASGLRVVYEWLTSGL